MTEKFKSSQPGRACSEEPLGRRLICFLQFLGLNVLFILFASIQFCPIADHAMLTVGRSARDLLGTLAAWSKEKSFLCCSS